MEKISDLNLYKLNMYIETWTTINNVDIPIYIDIADINEYEEYSLNNKVEIVGDKILIDYTDNPFKKQLDDYKTIKDIKYYLKFVDNRKLFDGKSWIEMMSNNFGTDIYTGMQDIGLSLDMFKILKNEIVFHIHKLKTKCLQIIVDLLDYDRDFPNIHLKDTDSSKLMKRYKEYLNYTQHMSLMQNAFEYTDSILFPENKGRAFFEYSFREINLKVMYISMKSRIESFINTLQSKSMERD